MERATDLSPVFAALRFAADRHRDQRRKDEVQAPYVNHLIAVLDLLWDIGGVRDPLVLCAAVLHDTLEDTDTTGPELEERFGRRVAEVVAELTDDKSLPKQRRKELQVEKAGGKSDAAKLVKLADKISNVSDVVDAAPRGWDAARRREYVGWARAVVDRGRGANPALEAHFDRLCERADNQLS